MLVWHRRARKTSTAINEVAKQAHLKKGVYWIVFPTYNQAKEAIWKDPTMLFRIIPEEIIARKNEVELTLYLQNGSVISLKGADNPDSLRGAGPYGIIFDEFADMKMEAWQITEPVIRANGGWAWFIGTPKGRNHLHDLYIRGQKKDEEWKSWLLKASTSGIIPADQLAKSKETQPQDMFNQEWECEFLEGEGQVFKGVREVCTAVPQKPLQNHVYVMGVDLAKVQDYTVITVYDRETNAQVYQDRFQTIEWPFQKKKIRAVAKHYNNALVMIDATGLGDPIADDLTRSGVQIQPVKFTEQVKKDLIEKLSIWIEQKKIKILPRKETLFEFDNFSYSVGITGRIRYGAPEGYHDDIVIAHALAVSSLNPITREEVIVPKTALQKAYEQQKENYSEDSEEYLEEWAETT